MTDAERTASVREVMIVRHPETVANRDGRFIGSGDSPFTGRGVQQREEVAAAIVSWGPERIYVSPLQRTRALARAADPEGERTEVLHDLREIGFGDAEGLTWSEIRERGMTIARTGPGPVAPGGERVVDFEERVRRAADAIEAGPDRAVVVTHGGVMRRLLTHWLELPVEAGWRFALPNGVSATVRFADGHASLVGLQPPLPRRGACGTMLGTSAREEARGLGPHDP